MDLTATQEAQPTATAIDFRTDPSRYKHWRLSFDGPVAMLTMDVAEDGGIRPGYKLKLNSYDLGVDIELHDALQRIRFEHPEIRSVVITSAKNRIFCSGANIYMPFPSFRFSAFSPAPAASPASPTNATSDAIMPTSSVPIPTASAASAPKTGASSTKS